MSSQARAWDCHTSWAMICYSLHVQSPHWDQTSPYGQGAGLWPESLHICVLFLSPCVACGSQETMGRAGGLRTALLWSWTPPGQSLQPHATVSAPAVILGWSLSSPLSTSGSCTHCLIQKSLLMEKGMPLSKQHLGALKHHRRGT